MSSVITASDPLEYTSHTSPYDKLEALPLVLPAPRHGRTHRFAFLHALFTLRLRRHRASECTSQFSHEPEPPLDALARKYPDLYMTAL